MMTPFNQRQPVEQIRCVPAPKGGFGDGVELVLGSGLEVTDWSAFRERYGYGLFPELIYRPADNLEITLGFFIVDGRDDTLFGTWRETNQVYAKVKVVFEGESKNRAEYIHDPSPDSQSPDIPQ